MLSLLSRLDAAVQKAVDAFVFFLMRHLGWKKSFIRYGSYSVAVTCIASVPFLQAAAGVPLTEVGFGALAVLVPLFLFIQWADCRQDLEAERRPGAASRADRYDLTDAAFKMLFWILAITNVAGFWRIPLDWRAKELPAATCHMMTAMLELLHAAMLFLAYLKRTPSNPPPAEEKLPAAAQPSPVKS